MSLKTKDFVKFRNKAMVARKERYESRQHEVIETLPEIAAKLKETPMVKGKNILK
jgi:hypothetical protein